MFDSQPPQFRTPRPSHRPSHQRKQHVRLRRARLASTLRAYCDQVEQRPVAVGAQAGGSEEVTA